jgi:hypothetical protein
MYNHELLYERAEELRPWAIKECTDHLGFATKNRVICLDCGERFGTAAVKRKRAVCPHCGQALKIEYTGKRSHRQTVHFAIAEVFRDFQVIRNFRLSSHHKDGRMAVYYCYEILQHWIREDGKREVVALLHSLNWNIDSWSGCMKIRDKRYEMKYDVYSEKYHPLSEFAPKYRKLGIDSSLQGLTALEAIEIIPQYPAAETLLKAKQYDLLAYYSDHRRALIGRYWPSVKICIRNKYRVKDADIWFDYLDLLSHMGKDLKNARYVCPKNLKKAHDELMKLKRRMDNRRRLENDYIDLLIHFNLGAEMVRKDFTEMVRKDFVFPKHLKREYDILYARKKQEEKEQEEKRRSEDEKEYRRFVERFDDMVLRQGEINIVPLKSIEEIEREGDAMNHCIYTNEYWKKGNLLLSARINNEPVETIEFDIREMKLLQCRGRSNRNTEYHDRIIKIVKRNKKQIAERVKMKICQ